jgi:hypothetical protein
VAGEMMVRKHDKHVAKFLPLSQVKQLIRQAETTGYSRGFVDGHNGAWGVSMKYRDRLQDINMALMHIETLFSVPGTNHDWLMLAAAGLDNELQKLWNDFLDLVLRMEPAPPPEAVREFGVIVGRYVSCIKLFLAGKNNGETLRSMSDDKPANHIMRRLKDFANEINMGGAPSGMQPWREKLGRMIIDLEQKSPSYSLDRIGRIIRSKLEEKRDLSPDESEILERLSLKKRSEPGNMKRYIRDVRRDYLSEHQTSFDG